MDVEKEREKIEKAIRKEEKIEKIVKIFVICVCIFAFVVFFIYIPISFWKMWKLSKDRPDTTTTTKPKTCQYEYSDGSVCGLPADVGTLCQYHYVELDTTYKDLMTTWDKEYEKYGY